MPHRSIAFASIAVAAMACASAGTNGANRKSCDLPARDSVFRVSGPVFRDCAVDRTAQLTSNAIHPDYQPIITGSACYSADVEFVVDTAGRPETQTALVVRTNDHQLAESVLAMLSRLHYEPALREQMPVRQIVAMHMAMGTRIVAVSPRAGPPPSSPPPGGSSPPC